MISRSAGYKIHFRKQPPFRGNICPLIVGVMSFVSLNIYAPVKTFTLTIEGISAISLSSQKPRCFNNVILHLNEINRIQKRRRHSNYSGKSSPFIQRRAGEPSLSEYVRKP